MESTRRETGGEQHTWLNLLPTIRRRNVIPKDHLRHALPCPSIVFSCTIGVFIPIRISRGPTSACDQNESFFLKLFNNGWSSRPCLFQGGEGETTPAPSVRLNFLEEIISSGKVFVFNLEMRYKVKLVRQPSIRQEVSYFHKSMK